MANSRKTKITKNSMFYSESDFNYDLEMGMYYLEHDVNQKVLVFQVDRTRTNTESESLYDNSIIQQSIAYKEPVEINVIYSIDKSQNKSYDKSQNVGRYLQVGNLVFFVYEKTLKDNKIDISFGDYIGVQVTSDQIEYFTVTNDGRVNYDNEHSMFGYKPLYRTIECVPSDKNEFIGK